MNPGPAEASHQPFRPLELAAARPEDGFRINSGKMSIAWPPRWNCRARAQPDRTRVRALRPRGPTEPPGRDRHPSPGCRSRPPRRRRATPPGAGSGRTRGPASGVRGLWDRVHRRPVEGRHQGRLGPRGTGHPHLCDDCETRAVLETERNAEQAEGERREAEETQASKAGGWLGRRRGWPGQPSRQRGLAQATVGKLALSAAAARLDDMNSDDEQLLRGRSTVKTRRLPPSPTARPLHRGPAGRHGKTRRVPVHGETRRVPGG